MDAYGKAYLSVFGSVGAFIVIVASIILIVLTGNNWFSSSELKNELRIYHPSAKQIKVKKNIISYSTAIFRSDNEVKKVCINSSLFGDYEILEDCDGVILEVKSCVVKHWLFLFLEFSNY